MIRGEIKAKRMVFGQGMVVTGGYQSCPPMQCRAAVTTALTHPSPSFCCTDQSTIGLRHIPPHSLSVSVSPYMAPRQQAQNAVHAIRAILVRPGLIITASPQVPPLCCFTASPRPRPLGCCTAFPWPRPHVCISASPGPCLHHRLTASPRPLLISASLHHRGLALMAAVLHQRGRTLWSASLLPLGSATSMLHSSASSSALTHCSSMVLSLVLLPDLSGGGGGGSAWMFCPERSCPGRLATFPRMIQC